MHPSEPHCSLLDHLLYHKRHLLASEDELRADHSRRCRFWELNKDTPIQSFLDILDMSIQTPQAPFPAWSDEGHQMIEPFIRNATSCLNIYWILEWYIKLHFSNDEYWMKFSRTWMHFLSPIQYCNRSTSWHDFASRLKVEVDSFFQFPRTKLWAKW